VWTTMTLKMFDGRNRAEWRHPVTQRGTGTKREKVIRVAGQFIRIKCFGIGCKSIYECGGCPRNEWRNPGLSSVRPPLLRG